MIIIIVLIYRNIRPTDHPFLGVLTGGEGWHNYHHVFPWDYKTAELGNYRFNITTAFIDFFAKIGKHHIDTYILFLHWFSKIHSFHCMLLTEKRLGIRFKIGIR